MLQLFQDVKVFDPGSGTVTLIAIVAVSS